MKTILGTDDTVTTCDCCGKKNLKKTVIVDIDGEVLHYGSVCATRWTGLSSKEIKKAINERHTAAVSAAKAEFYPVFHALMPALETKRIEARNLGLSGSKFAEFCKVENGAIRTRQIEIAAAHGVSVYEI